jgi:hypothetical protein
VAPPTAPHQIHLSPQKMDGDEPLERVTLGRNPSKKQASSSYIPKNIWAKYALYWSILQLVISCIFEIYIAVTHRKYVSDVSIAISAGSSGNFSLDGGLTSWISVQKNGEAITIYHALFMTAQFFQLVLLADALMQLSLIQLVTTTAFNWASWGYAIVQYSQASSWLSPNGTDGYTDKIPKGLSQHPTQGAEIALIVIFLIFCIGWIYLTYNLYFVFGWTTYKEMGADVQFRNVLYLYHIYVLLLKIDVFFFLGFDLQFLFLILIPGTNGGETTNTDVIVHALVSFPGTIIALVLAYYAVI